MIVLEVDFEAMVEFDLVSLHPRAATGHIPHMILRWHILPKREPVF